MTYFHSKDFDGIHFALAHLDPFRQSLPLDAGRTQFVDIEVTFGCHCFTEKFDPTRHRDHHRYVFRGELRAFDSTRYECCLHLPLVIRAIFSGRVHHADNSYTYVAHITLNSKDGAEPYSVFFSLERDSKRPPLALRMFIKSAYLKPLVARPHSKSWRFISLAGQICGAFEGPSNERARKKAP